MYKYNTIKKKLKKNTDRLKIALKRMRRYHRTKNSIKDHKQNKKCF